jgi:hypothetical protein
MAMRALVRLLAALVLAAGLAGCPPKPPPPPEKPGPAGGPGCDVGCARLAELGCDAAKPTPQGASCIEVCQNVQASGITSWDIPCMQRATSCPEADKCVH